MFDVSWGIVALVLLSPVVGKHKGEERRGMAFKGIQEMESQGCGIRAERQEPARCTEPNPANTKQCRRCILEVCEDRRETQPLYKSVLRLHGGKTSYSALSLVRCYRKLTM